MAPSVEAGLSTSMFKVAMVILMAAMFRARVAHGAQGTPRRLPAGRFQRRAKDGQAIGAPGGWWSYSERWRIGTPGGV
jgi:hypothetical protein